MISSAVIVPESEELSPRSPSHKRRQSSSSYGDQHKRPRLEGHVDGETNQTSSAPAQSPPRRKTGIASSRMVDERKRGQRLFGALLGTLSQSSTTTAQRRRADIEKKQLGKLQQRDEEAAEVKRRRKEKLDMIRRKEQIVWDEQGMRLRHSNMLAEAHFLKTNAEPKLYYKPWELRPEEDEQIKKQIEDAAQGFQTQIAAHDVRAKGEEETSEASKTLPSTLAANDVNGAHTGEHPEEHEVTAEGREPDAEVTTVDATTDEQRESGTDEKAKSQVNLTPNEEQGSRQDEKTNEDPGGEELVEGQEDDVIY